MSTFQGHSTISNLRQHYRPSARRVPVWLQRVWYWF